MKLLKPLSASDQRWLRRSRRILLVGFTIGLIGVLLGQVLADGTAVTLVYGYGITNEQTNEKKICRTSDSTIHVVLWGITSFEVWHYFSYNNGSTWSSETILTGAYYVAIDCDVNDNLIIASSKFSDFTKIYFRRGVVNKTGSWTWTWSSIITINASANLGFGPDIASDLNGTYYIAAGGATDTWFRSLNNGTTWIEGALASSNSWASIITDTANDIYISTIKWDCSRGPYMYRIENYDNGTYGSPSLTMIGGTACHVSLNITPTNYIILGLAVGNASPPTAITYYFRKASFPNSVTSFGIPVLIDGPFSSIDWGGVTSMVIDSVKYRIYYCSSILQYKETVDSGVNWGSATIIDSNPTCVWPNAAKKQVSYWNDYIWGVSVASPTGYRYIKYNALLTPPPATSTTVPSTTTTMTTTTTPSAVDLGGVCSGIGDALGITDEAGCMLLSFILFFMILVPLGMLTKSFWVLLVVGFTLAGFLTAVQWLPVWIMVMLSLIVALMLGSRLAGLTSRGGSNEGD